VAARVSVDGDEVVEQREARLVLRAAGETSLAERIVSRASGVHKIVGRMLRSTDTRRLHGSGRNPARPPPASPKAK
jgi:hypothetical protein